MRVTATLKLEFVAPFEIGVRRLLPGMTFPHNNCTTALQILHTSVQVIRAPFSHGHRPFRERGQLQGGVRAFGKHAGDADEARVPPGADGLRSEE